MEKLVIEVCPETGICSIVRPGGAKVDLMPDEAEAIRAADGDPVAIRAVIANGDPAFAASLSDAEAGAVSARL